MGRLGLGSGSGPYVVGRSGSEPRVGAGGYLRSIFSVGGCLRGVSPGVFFRTQQHRPVYYIHAVVMS